MNTRLPSPRRDGAAIHRSARVPEYVAKAKGEIWIERIPACAPGMNPVEYLWAHLKRHEICNRLARGGREPGLHATGVLRRMRRSRLFLSFARRSGILIRA